MIESDTVSQSRREHLARAPRRSDLLIFEQLPQGAPSPAPILSPRILHISASAPPARARLVRTPPAFPPRPLAARSRRRAARRPAAARRVEAQLHVDVLGHGARRGQVHPLGHARGAPRTRHGSGGRDRRARSGAEPPLRRASASARARSKTRSGSGRTCGAACWPSTSKAREPRSCSTARSMLLLGAAPIGSAVRAAAAEIDDFAFRPYVRTHALLLHLSSRGHLLELASAAPLLSFMASASLRSSSARNSARSGRPRRQVRGDHFTTVRRG
jgi:hypothetical protein